MGFLTKIIQAHSVHAASFTLHSTLSVIIWHVTHSFCTAFSAHSHITQNGIHSHARGPHSVRMHASTFAIIRIHSRRTAFSDTPCTIHSLSFMFIHVHTRTVTFTSNLIHGTFTGAAGARPPQPHTQRASFNRTTLVHTFSVHSFSFITDRIH